MDVYVILNFITLIVACVVCYYSFKLVLCLNVGIESAWWGVMPIAFLWATVNRAFVLLVSMDILPTESWSQDIATSQIVFWVLILIFKVGFYRQIKTIICPLPDKCKK